MADKVQTFWPLECNNNNNNNNNNNKLYLTRVTRSSKYTEEPVALNNQYKLKNCQYYIKALKTNYIRSYLNTTII